MRGREVQGLYALDGETLFVSYPVIASLAPGVAFPSEYDTADLYGIPHE